MRIDRFSDSNQWDFMVYTCVSIDSSLLPLAKDAGGDVPSEACFRRGFTSIARPGHSDELISAGGFWKPDEFNKTLFGRRYYRYEQFSTKPCRGADRY